MISTRARYLVSAFLLALLLFVIPAAVGQQDVCDTPRDVEKMNRGAVSRLFTLEGLDAKVFLAVDRRLLQYQEQFDSLMEQDVDLIVAWKLTRRPPLAAAVPFAGGCAATGYGEPDFRKKIKMMRDAVKLINKHGLNHQRTRDHLTELVKFEGIPEGSDELQTVVDQIIERVRGIQERGTAVSSATLEMAVRQGDLEKVARIAEQGVDVNSVGPGGLRALHWAVSAGHYEIAELLITRGANLEAQGPEGSRPLHFATDANLLKIATLLIDQGADVNARTADGSTSLHFSADAGYVEMVELLISSGADVNAKGNSDLSPLHMAAYEGQIAAAKLLIEKGADVNAKAMNATRPLHVAAFDGRTDMVKLLISHGADVNVVTYAGLTPRDHAASQKHQEIVELLDKHRAE